jgi:DNA invertase Pin-like site-specific DNA recombinase
MSRAGLKAARQRGRLGGRPKSLTAEKFDAARRLLDTGTPVRDVAAALALRYTEPSEMPMALAIARPVQWVAWCRG